MAKMFYTLDETKAALGKNEEEIKQLGREGRLREFRDGPRLMFKADQVEQLKAEMGGGGAAAPAEPVLDLGASDSGAPLGLAADSAGASGSGISLADSDIGKGPASSATPGAKEDTALAADLGLSASLGGVPSPGRVNPLSGTGVSSAQGSRAGINVFGTDEMPAVDPGAQTAISAGVRDQVNLESVGSGSGLLDLTRESDDTSLGAELLDEISPGASKKGGTGAGTAAGDTAVAPAVDAGIGESKTGVTRPVGAPLYVEARDNMAPAFAGAAAGAAIMIAFGGFVLISAMCGYWPAVLESFKTSTQPLLFVVLVGAVVSAVGFVIGFVAGKFGGR